MERGRLNGGNQINFGHDSATTECFFSSLSHSKIGHEGTGNYNTFMGHDPLYTFGTSFNGGNPYPVSDSLRVGCYFDTNETFLARPFFKGDIDEIALFVPSLSRAEISEIYEASKTDPLWYKKYKLNTTNYRRAQHTSGNSNICRSYSILGNALKGDVSSGVVIKASQHSLNLEFMVH